MSLAYKKRNRSLVLQGILLVVLALAGNFSLQAESPPAEDLGDNEICLDCHLDEAQVGALEVSGPQVHNPEDSTLIEKAHVEVVCIDCHMDIEQVPHSEINTRTVDCLACHESTPE